MTKLNGTLQYDDGVIVYINGQRIAAFDDNACDASGNSLNKGFDANLQYGGSNAGTPKTVSFELLDLSVLHTGTNTIAVELHNGRATSSDVWFHLTDLALSDEEVVYQTNISPVSYTHLRVGVLARVSVEEPVDVRKQNEEVRLDRHGHDGRERILSLIHI